MLLERIPRLKLATAPHFEFDKARFGVRTYSEIQVGDRVPSLGPIKWGLAFDTLQESRVATAPPFRVR